MSTTIGPAFKLARNLDLFTFADNLRAVAHPAMKQFFFQNLHDMAVCTYDLAKQHRPFMEVIRQELNEYCHCRTDDRPWVTNQIANLKAYLYRDSDQELYLLVQGAPSEVREAISGMPEVEGDYDYYDNTDTQLEYLTEEEWHARRDKWAELLTLHAPLSSRGLTISLGIEPYTLKVEDYEQVKNELTTDPDNYRLERIKKNIYGRLIMGTAKTQEEKTRISSEFMNSIMSLQSRALSEEFPDQLAQSEQDGLNLWEERRHLA